MNARLFLQGTLIQVYMGLVAWKTRARPTHPTGVGAAGMFMADLDPRWPDHEFFAPGARYPVRLRHATVDLHDDAGMDVRSASLKFSDRLQGGPLDIVMNSGTGSVYANTAQFLAFGRARKQGTAGAASYRNSNPLGYEVGIERLRRAPGSFARLHYHSQVCYRFRRRDGVARYIRYRLIPAEDGPEDGIPSREDREALWAQPRLPDETRPPNYLREEFKNRLADGTVRYQLQAQLHIAEAGESHEIFNASRPWDEQVHPWLDVGRVELDRALSELETETLSFSPANQPPSLGVIAPKSAEDYNSIVYLRIRAYRAAHLARTLRRRLNQRKT